MKYTFDPKYGGMTQKKDPAKEIQNAVRSDSSIERGHVFEESTIIRNELAICTENGNHYCVVSCNGVWRCIGRIVNMPAIRFASYGPMVNFHLAWQSGVPVEDPRHHGE